MAHGYGPIFIVARLCSWIDGLKRNVAPPENHKVNVEDAFLGWLRLVDRNTRALPALPAPSSVAHGDDRDVDAAAEDLAVAEFDAEASATVGDDVLVAGEALDLALEFDEGGAFYIHDELLVSADVPSDAGDSVESEGLAEALGMAAPPTPTLGVEEAPEEVDVDARARAMAAMEEVAELFCDDVDASDAVAGEVRSAAPAAPDDDYVMSELGYVKRRGESDIVGLVSTSHGGKTLFGNCHLHRKCSVQTGIVRRPVPHSLVARWLCAGVPDAPDASREERDRSAKDHISEWKRMLAEFRNSE